VVNIRKLKGKIVERQTSIEKLAEHLGIDRSTLYRKLGDGGESLTIREVNAIVKALNLSLEEANAIFFSQFVA